MTTLTDENVVREFVRTIHALAERAINGRDPGLLQLVQINPADERVCVSRYRLGDTDRMTRDAIVSADAGHNVYVEGRTVQIGLRGNKRG